MGTMSFDEFQGHSARGQKRNFLKGWKDKDPYNIRVWIMGSILASWRHPFVKEKRDTKNGAATCEIWSDKLVCWEEEELLQHQNFFDKVTRTRDEPPVLCPHCLMIDYLRNEILAKRLDWREPVFKFRHDDPQKVVILHAGGICGMFNEKNLPAEKKKELVEIPRDKGGPVYLRGNTPNVAFKQDSKAKLEYAFSIIDADDPGKGIQTTWEGQLLGQRVQGVLNHTVKSLGPERGNIQKFPYAMQWEHNPAENIPWDKKYEALRMESIRMTPGVEKLLREPPPDLASMGKRFNPKTHLANLERQALIPLPFERFFAKAISIFEADARAAPPSSAGGAPPDVGRGMDTSPGLAPAPAAPPPPDPNTVVACDQCHKPIKISDPQCGHCGMKYTVDADPLPLPPALPTRAQALAAASANMPGPSPAVDEGDAGDDIPFVHNSVLTQSVDGIACELWHGRSFARRVI